MTSKAATEAPADLAAEPVNLLIADDEHLVASGVAANLRDLGYNVVGPATDGSEAIELCRETQPDLALLDIRMPTMDGITAARTIFEELGIPVVLFSAYSDKEYVEEEAAQASSATC